MTATAVLPQNIRSNAVTIVNADGSNLKTVGTAAGTFWTITALIVTSDDTSARVLQFHLTIGGTDYLVGTVSVPAASGTDGSTATVNILASSMMQNVTYDAFANRVMHIDTGIVLKVKSTSTVTSAKTVTVFCAAAES